MKQILNNKSLLYLIILVILFIICGLVYVFIPKKPTSIEEEVTEESTIYFEYNNVALKPGETFQLETQFSDNNQREVIYVSNDESVATVSSTGEITALKEGITNIDALIASGEETSIQVVVSKETIALVEIIPIEEIKINSSNVSIKSGQAYQLSYDVLPSNATNKEIMWETDDARIATVTDTGLVTGRTSGTVTLTAYSTNNVVASINVTVEALTVTLTSLELAPYSMTIGVGDTYQLTTYYSPSNITNKSTQYSSSNSSIVSVNGSGLITGVKSGSAVITATSNGKTASTTITVDQSINIIQVTSISSISSLNLSVGESSNISVTFLPSDATNKNLVWVSSNKNVATVDNKGKVTAVSNGTSTITIKSTNGKTSTVIVTVEGESTVEATEVLLSMSSITLEPGQTKQLRATILPLTASQDVTWFSGQESVATVSSTGLVSALSYGTTTISALSSDGKVAKATIKVSYPDITPATAAKSAPSGSMTEEELTKINAHLASYVDEAEINGFNGKYGNRARVMAAAYWLVYNPYYRVQYVWGYLSQVGDKENFNGWNPEWSSTVGLECQNFVMWSLWQAGAYNNYPTASILQHSTHTSVSSNVSVDEWVNNMGVEAGDIIRRSRTDTANGHWAIVMEVNKEECYILVAHASDPNSDTLLTKYKCGSTFNYQHLYKLPDFYGN
ncbi:MAG: Ig-like domain-containing protein [Bacilli bacterium]|nr:Ig-like domain-containing protein [Bacilli bacterium]